MDFKAISSWSNLHALKIMGGAVIMDLHNRDVVDFFPNGQGRHGSVLRLMDSCYKKI